MLEHQRTEKSVLYPLKAWNSTRKFKTPTVAEAHPKDEVGTLDTLQDFAFCEKPACLGFRQMMRSHTGLPAESLVHGTDIVMCDMLIQNRTGPLVGKSAFVD